MPDPSTSIMTIRYRDGDGIDRTCNLDTAAAVAFEGCLPARQIPTYPGQRHTPGTYWAATTGELIDYESYLERQHLVLLDFDPDITAMAGQPLLLEGIDDEGAWQHVPDIFARTREGGGILIDVRAPRRLARAEVQRQAHRTAAVCRAIGWEYRHVSAVDERRWQTISWLAAYRRPLHGARELIDPLIAAAAEPTPIGTVITACPVPELAKPVLLHLCWHHRLGLDLDGPLGESTLVWSQTQVAPEEEQL